MGFFRDMLNPFSTKNPIANPGGAIIGNALNGNMRGVLTGGLDPSKPHDAAPPAPAVSAPTTAPGPNYLGDSSDPTYGSFAKPFDVTEFYKQQDPAYSFRLQQGTQALQNSAAAGSGALSGAALKDLLAYNQDYASQEYGNAFNRYQVGQGNIFSRLMQLAGMGQSSASNVGAQGTALAGQAGQAVQNQGTAIGGGIVGAGNAASGALGTYGGYQWLAQNPQMWHGSAGPSAVSP